MGKLLKFLDETENHLLNFVRRSILVVAVLAITLAGIIMIMAGINFFDRADISHEENIWPKIKWDEPFENIIEKQERLKKEETNKSKKKTVTKKTEDTPLPVKEVKNDPDVLVIVKNYKRAFPEKYETDKIVKAVKYYKKLVKRKYGEDRTVEFMDQLIDYSNDLGDYYHSFKFKLTDEQSSIVTTEVEQTLNTFVNRFEKAVSDRISEARESNAEARRNNQKAMGQIMWSLYLLGSVVVIIFVILLFKFEIGLREISPSINRTKSSKDEE